ncbi:auxin-responsive protein IAA33-like [Phoenix dactylifera]|uniref:Auxin-responsive protein n=1 Tax=Phoenix dactylifera TaxID=42345 RepID=A0A8B7CWX1_PHODC|nr:auxin-responsive protein IAA33-like [Phoenix dactylifera]
MNRLDSYREASKRPWDEKGSLYLSTGAPFYPRITSDAGGASTAMRALPPPAPINPRKLLRLSALDDDVASTVVPSVTVVLEGRSICHRIHLHKHSSYKSLAMALRRMFVDVDDDEGLGGNAPDGLDLSNAVPGYMVAYEDMEDDLLLAGDLNWKDFVRVTKRIRIIPAKASRRKHCKGP